MNKADRGRTRWRRMFILFIPALLGVLILTVCTLQGVLPVHLAISGQEFKLTSNGGPVTASEGLSAYPDRYKMKDGDHVPVLVAGVPHVQLDKGICISLVLTLPIVGTNTIRITSSGKATVEDLKADADALKLADATLGSSTTDGKPPAPDGSNVKAPAIINKDASQLNTLKGGHAGTMGLEVPGNTQLGSLEANAKGATISGTAKLDGLDIPSIGHGRGVEHGECY